MEPCPLHIFHIFAHTTPITEKKITILDYKGSRRTTDEISMQQAETE